MNDIAVDAPLRILAANPRAMERVPAVADLDISPDTGRMTTRLPSAERRGSSPAPSAAATGPPLCITLFGTAKLNGVDPQAWLADVLARIADTPLSRLPDLLPWNWAPLPAASQPA